MGHESEGGYVKYLE
jgi:hypothetical protein